MKKRKYRTYMALVLLISLALCGCKKEEPEQGDQTGTRMLNSSIPWEMGFLAAGDGGLLLEISAEGNVQEIQTGSQENFLDIWTDGKQIFLAGEDGQIYRGDAEYSFIKEESGCKEELGAGVSYLGREYCGGENGTVIVSSGDGSWELCSVGIEGTVTGMEASESRCLLVTDKGEAAVTENGDSWTVLRYGEYYQKEVTFQGLAYDGSNFCAYGKTEEGTRLFYTDSGMAWTERDINYLEGNNADLSEIDILSMASDGQQFYAWCGEGRLFTFPDCVQCNKETKVEGVISGTASYNGGKLLIAEDADHLTVLDTEAAKQYRVSAETAYQRQQEGAVLIDVRSLEDHEEKAIKGSVSIPLGEVEERLPEEYPDLGQVLIFYCAQGIRSQSAVETARRLGYVEVYSMGSIEDWNYEWE